MCLVLGLIPLYLLWRHTADTPRQHKSINAAELSLIEDGQETPGPKAETIPLKTRLSGFAGNYRYWLLVFWYLCLQCMYWGLITWLPSYLKTARNFSWQEMGWLASLPFVLSIIFKVFSGVLADTNARLREANQRLADRNSQQLDPSRVCPGWFGHSAKDIHATRKRMCGK